MSTATITFTEYDGTLETLPLHKEPLLLIRKGHTGVVTAQLVRMTLFDADAMAVEFDHWRGERIHAASPRHRFSCGTALPVPGDRWALVSDIQIQETTS